MMLEMVETGYGTQAVGRGSAIAVVFFVIVLIITLTQRRFIREEGEAA
jgi:multiple sugar transport system permease protein